MQKNNFLDLCLEALRKHGHKVTGPREEVARVVAATPNWFTLKSLQEKIETVTKTPFDFVTLYRIIALFEELGLVHPAKKTGFYIACQHLQCDDLIHVVYSCLGCQQVFESHLSKDLAAKVMIELKLQNDFLSTSRIMQVSGSCANCQR